MTSPSPHLPPLNVFVSYSHRDETFKDELVIHLANLKRQGKIRAWQDRDIEAGTEWDAEIKQQLEAAEIILLLITPQFMASDYCYNLEMQRAIQRHQEGTARVIPIIVKPCDWENAPFSALQVLPKDALPITQWNDRDAAFLNVVQGIRRAVESLHPQPLIGAISNSTTASPVPHPSSTPVVASSATAQPFHPSISISFSTYDSQTFTGRDEETEHLSGVLQDDCRLLLIHGMTGIGKTALAERLADRFVQPPMRYVQVILDRGISSTDFTSGALAILAKLDDDTAQQRPDEQLLPHLLQTLERQPCWLQLDSLEALLCQNDRGESHFTDPTWLDFFEQFLTLDPSPVAPGSRLVLTSQSLPMDWSDRAFRLDNLWYEYPLHGLEKSQRIDLFRRHGVTPKTSAETDYLCAIADYFDGHPLILKMIAGDIQKRPFNGSVETYWRDYYHQRQTQTTLKLARSQEERARHWVRQILEQLPDLPRQMLQRASVFRRPVPERFYLALLSNTADSERDAALTVLKSRNLVEEIDFYNGELRIQQHNLIREIARTLLKADLPTWQSAERQAAHLWLTAYTPAPDAPTLETVRGYLEAFDHYCTIEDWNTAQQTAWTRLNTPTESYLCWQLGMWGYYREQVLLYTSLLKIARNTGNRQGENVLHGLGMAYSYLGQYQQAIACHQQYLVIAREIGDRPGEGAVLGNLGGAYDKLGQYQQALECHQQFLAIAREIGDRQYQSNALGGLGNTYYSMKQYEQAIDCHRQSLQIAQELGDRRGEGVAFGNLGLVYDHLGQYQQAIDFHQQCLTVMQSLDDRGGEGAARVNLGGTYLKMKRYAEALTENQTALTIVRETGDRLNEAEALKNLAELHLALGETAIARQYGEQALTLATELGIPLKEDCQKLMHQLEAIG
ncbi:tetratricopeptide repeat protein [Oscillatoria sp. FACHB-1407]|uniref:tetratricopeptide repeat protein n=1 Tax=Oscillatoria sp. FACHB-1407 TaxID=2692847 RepID=UPI001686C49D|nr:tetratricopeptide repeat protein [Oscillatoria sp. FACHB-1407]MBD2460896.1 tetratricopeptide repeat protein [Oscillatoria sp. FACHB-1407]